MPARICSSVLFPEPFWPMIPSVCPDSSSKEMSFKRPEFPVKLPGSQAARLRAACPRAGRRSGISSTGAELGWPASENIHEFALGYSEEYARRRQTPAETLRAKRARMPKIRHAHAQQTIPVAGNDMSQRIPSDQKAQLGGKPVGRIKDRRKPEPEGQNHAEHLGHIAHEYVQAGNEPGQSQSKKHQEEKIDRDQEDENAYLAQGEEKDDRGEWQIRSGD